MNELDYEDFSLNDNLPCSENITALIDTIAEKNRLENYMPTLDIKKHQLPKVKNQPSRDHQRENDLARLRNFVSHHQSKVSNFKVLKWFKI